MDNRLLLKNLGDRISKLRTESGLSQLQLAQATDNDLQEIQSLENGTSDPTIIDLMRIAKAMNASTEKLFIGL